MLAEQKTQIRVIRIWKLKSPAHHTDVSAALNLAVRAREADAGRDLYPEDIQLIAWDDEIRVQYERDFDLTQDT